jgi:hypothetical protein
MPHDAERAWRRRLITRALDAVAVAVDRPTVFEVEVTGSGSACPTAGACGDA